MSKRYFCCTYLPDYCFVCGLMFFPRSAVNNFFYEGLGFVKWWAAVSHGGKMKVFCSLERCGGHIRRLGVYIEMHAFAISVCWLYKATLKT